MRRYLVLAALGVLVGLLLVGIAAFSTPYSFRGSQIQPPVQAPDFALQDGQGGMYRLSEQRGKLVMIFFGYTSCPDVCPTTLNEMQQVKARLKDQADNVQFVFITVDPERDTPERMREYVSSFDADFIGLSGSEQELHPVWKGYGVYREKRASSSGMGYTMDHSAFVYVIDQDGNLRETFSFGAAVNDIFQDVSHLLKE